MSQINTVIVSGRLTSDPQKMVFQSDNELSKFTIAYNRIYTKDGEKTEEVHFFDCEVFGKTATFVNQYLTKGRSVLIEGRLKQDKWEDKTSGDKRSKVVISVEKLNSLDSPKNTDDVENNKEPCQCSSSKKATTSRAVSPSRKPEFSNKQNNEETPPF